MNLNPGARLGPYEILEPIGAGGVDEVYKARDTRLDPRANCLGNGRCAAYRARVPFLRQRCPHPADPGHQRDLAISGPS